MMKKTLLQIKMMYPEMGKAEKKIAEWVQKNPDGVLPLSISELADQCGCGEATIVRFARRLGFGGYQELKISLAQESGKSNVGESLTPNDSCGELLDKVTDAIYCTLEMTRSEIDREALAAAAEALLHSRKIVVFGLGNSASIALDIQHKFLRLGYDVTAYSDNHMQAIAASHLGAGDTAIGISHSGSSRDIVEAMHLARERGATAIALTNSGKSPIVKESSIVLSTASRETQYSILGLNSRIAQLAIVNALYYYVIFRSRHGAQAIRETERALQTKKY